MSILNRIKAFFVTLQAKWSDDPAARGAAKITLGAALLAEGIFGFARGSRTSFSLFGSLVLGVGAAVFIAVGLFISPDTYPDGIKVQGSLSDILEGRDSDRNHSYKSVYSYIVNDKTYTHPHQSHPVSDQF